MRVPSPTQSLLTTRVGVRWQYFSLLLEIPRNGMKHNTHNLRFRYNTPHQFPPLPQCSPSRRGKQKGQTVFCVIAQLGQRSAGLLMHLYFYFFALNFKMCICSWTFKKKTAPFSMAIGEVEGIAQLFSQTHTHGNKTEIRQRNRRR